MHVYFATKERKSNNQIKNFIAAMIDHKEHLMKTEKEKNACL